LIWSLRGESIFNEVVWHTDHPEQRHMHGQAEQPRNSDTIMKVGHGSTWISVDDAIPRIHHQINGALPLLSEDPSQRRRKCAHKILRPATERDLVSEFEPLF
jgi:hypothetical protein